MGNALGGVVAGGLLGAIIGFSVAWFLGVTSPDPRPGAVALGLVLFGLGAVAGAVVGGVEDLLRGMRRPEQPAPPSGP